MKIVFLCPYPNGRAPSQRFRFEQYLQSLRDLNVEVIQFAFWSVAAWNILYSRGKYAQKIFGFMGGYIRRFMSLPKLVSADYIFIHRECTPIGPPVVEWIIAKVLKKKIIFDFDDAIWLPNTSEENKIVSTLKWHQKTKAICKWSYKVSCGNRYLADFARQFNPNVVVNPTTIDTEHLHYGHRANTAQSPGVIIGWTGTHSTFMYYLMLEPLLRKMKRKHSDLQFVVISNKPPLTDLESLTFIPWNKATEIDDLLKFDIGIMPLADDHWSEGKCGFKALQYMALNIPTVASAIGVNKRIIDNGINGFLCANLEEWEHALESLIKNPAVRKTIGENGRKKVVQDYSVSSNTSNFLSFFE
jgi:glycosyltransferase involved in cell wall biosynthesis